MKKEKVHDNAIKNITETGALKMGKITEEKRAEASEKNFQNDPNVIYIQMLGGFSMTYQGQPLLLGKSFSSKMLHLLMLLIYSRGEGIRRTRAAGAALRGQRHRAGGQFPACHDFPAEKKPGGSRSSRWRVYFYQRRHIHVGSGACRCGA